MPETESNQILNLLEGRYLFFVWASRFSLPIAAFIYGFLSYSSDIGASQSASGTTDPLMDAIFGPGLLIVLLSVAARVYYGLKIRKYLFTHYAKVFEAKEAMDDPRVIINPDSVLLGKACFPRFTNFAMGRYKNHRLCIGELTVGYIDISKFTRYESVIYADYMVFALQLRDSFPHIFVDGHSQNILTPKYRNLWTLRWKLRYADKSQKLEGDFPKHFDVYTPPEQQIETLSILTPDVMQVMKDLGRGFDYEIIENHLYIIAEPNVLKMQKADEIIHAVTTSLDELLHQMQRPKATINQAHLQTGSGKIAGLSVIFYYTFGGIAALVMFFFITTALILGSLLKLIIELLF